MSGLIPARSVRRKCVAILVAVSTPFASGAPAIAQEGASPSSDYLVLRSTGRHLTPAMEKALSANLPNTVLDEAKYPQADRFTPTEIARVICGSADNEFIGRIAKLNELTLAEMGQPAGKRAWSLKIPPCLFVRYKPQTYIAKPEDEFSTIYETFTGIRGSVEGKAAFFGVSPARIQSERTDPGEPLKIPHATAGLVLPREVGEKVFEALEQKAGDETFDYLSRAEPRPGRIVTNAGHVAGAAWKAETPVECGSGEQTPFPAQEVADAFAFAKERSKKSLRTPFDVRMMVVDNGFIGARRSAAGLVFAEPDFPGDVFNAVDFPNQLGPTVGRGANLTYPLKPAPPAPDGLVGHGTHVTGLALGGPGFVGFRPAIFGSGGPSWLQVSEINVGKTEAFLIEGSELELFQQLSLLKDGQIVNMSISYEKTQQIAGSFGFMNKKDTLHLYVVAAGNEDGSNARDYLPAGLGGLQSNSVITVAALAPDGSLAKFSNMGPAADVAAPGCNIKSWVDDKGTKLPLSGTSQASPIVAFEAALIRALMPPSRMPADIKDRIITSGDLLPDADRGKLSAGVKVNLVKALYVYDDYVRYRLEGDQNDTIVLGTLLSVDGLTCDDGQGSLDVDKLAALKRGGASWGYRRAAGDETLSLCRLEPTPKDAMIAVRPRNNVGGTYGEIQDKTVRNIPTSAVLEIVRKSVRLPGA